MDVFSLTFPECLVTAITLKAMMRNRARAEAAAKGLDPDLIDLPGLMNPGGILGGPQNAGNDLAGDPTRILPGNRKGRRSRGGLSFFLMFALSFTAFVLRPFMCSGVSVCIPRRR